jgi:hypothetical protein
LENSASIAGKKRAKAILSNAYFKLLEREGAFQIVITDDVKANQAI